jgi:hypothetical protein
MMTLEEKKARAEGRKAIKDAEKENARRTEERIDRGYHTLTITVEWKKSRTWGYNPHVQVTAKNVDGPWGYANSTASGCGYDKESQAVADALNELIQYKLWQKWDSGKWDDSRPYGVAKYGDGSPRFCGGVGVSCMYGIAKWVGGEWRTVASGKLFNVYELTF